MWTYVFLITVVTAAIVFEISFSFKDQDDTAIRIIVKEILEKEHRNQDKLTEMADLKATIYEQRQCMAAMQKQIAGLKDVIIGQTKELMAMDVVIKELKSTINGVKQSDVAVENNILETIVTDDVQTQIRDKNEEQEIDNVDATSPSDDIRPTDNKTEMFKVLEKDQDKRSAPNQQSKISQRTFISTGGVAFSAYLSHDVFNMGIGHTVKCDKVLLNEGNSYSPFTGTFTVPKTGVYLLTFSIDAYYNGDTTDVKLVVNNMNIVDARARVIGVNHDVMGGNTAIVRLTQGESVWLEIYHTNNVELVSPPDFRWTTFSGVFLFG